MAAIRGFDSLFRLDGKVALVTGGRYFLSIVLRILRRYD